ncbi:YkgJ family cysteine cluster protein [Sorangium sp. So ce185]|uniref:YkgJ family cysteine cluster protein n=1 Tax=Sorangium sp. So ce185 TaxID=3133287 RepID=UPI003F6026FF
MLSPLQIILDEESFVRQELRKGRDASTGPKLAQHGLRTGTELLKKDQAGTSRRRLPVCKETCSWCCRGVKVDVSIQEALVIAEHKRSTLSVEMFSQFREQIAQLAEQTRDLHVDDRARQQLPCPLLDQSGSCSVYEVRPLRCAGHNSYDASACEWSCQNPDLARDIPADAAQQAIFSAVTMGQQRGLVAAGIDARSFELVSALRVALEQPNAAERWAKGERLFDAADRRIDREDREAAFRDLSRTYGVDLPPELAHSTDPMELFRALAAAEGRPLPPELAPPAPLRMEKTPNQLKRERRARKKK